MDDGSEVQLELPKGPTLMQKLQVKHVQALSDFQVGVRNMSRQLDEDEFRVLGDLRTTLTMSRDDTDKAIRALREQNAAQRKVVDEARAKLEGRDAEDFGEIFADEIHQDGVQSSETRQERMEIRRTAILETGLELRKEHDRRMELIQGTADWLRDCEAKRKSKLTTMLEALLLELCTIAYVNVTEAQLAVQRAAVSANEQLLANQLTAKRLIGQLQQHELYRQRDVAEAIAEIYAEACGIMASSAITWVACLFASKAFRAPQIRTQVLLRVSQSYTNTKSEIGHMLHGLTTLILSLVRRREGSSMEEICGGTEASGWLRSLDDNVAHPIFPKSPNIIADEWKVFIDVILHNAQVSVVTMTNDCSLVETQMINEMERLAEALNADLEALYAPTEIEQTLVSKIALDPENPFPLHKIKTNVDAAEAAKLEASQRHEALKAAVREESDYFMDRLTTQMDDQKQRLVDRLVGKPGSVVPMLLDASEALEVTATKILQLIRDFFNHHSEAFNDYKDQLRWLEEDLERMTDKLSHAGTADDATEACVECMDLLAKIEELYRSHHNSRVDGLQPFIETLASTVREVVAALHSQLQIVTKETIDSHNAAISAEELAREEKLKGMTAKELKQMAPLPELPQRIDVESLDTMTIAGVSFYLKSKDLGFGYPDGVPVQEPEPSPLGATINASADTVGGESPVAPSNAASPSPVPAEKGEKKPRSRGGKNKRAASVELEPPPPPPPEPTRTHFDAFKERTEMSFGPVFYEEALLSNIAIPELKATMRETMVSWALTLDRTSETVVKTYCGNTKAELDEMTNGNVRRHQRRAPQLQSHVFEVRIRELQDVAQARSKHFAWLQSRVSQCQQICSDLVDRSNSTFMADVERMLELIEHLDAVTSTSGLETQGRVFADKKKKMLVAVQERAEHIRGQLVHYISAVRKECNAYESERLKTFDEGGDISPDEVERARELIRQIREKSDAVEADVNSTVEKMVAVQEEQTQRESDHFDAQLKKNMEELRFFLRMQELFAHVKSRINNQVSSSNNSESTLTQALQRLEGLVAKASQRKDVSSLASDLLGVNYETAGQVNVSGVEVDQAWENDDVVLSTKLRASRVELEALIRRSRAMEVLLAFDDLRKLLYTRGLYLGCLAYNCEFVNQPEEGFIDPLSEAEMIRLGLMSPVGEQTTGKGGKKDKAADKKGKGRNSVVASTPEVPENAWNRFLRVERADKVTNKILNPARESLTAAASEYFSNHTYPLVRSGILSGTVLEDVNATISTRLTELDEKSAAHVVAAIKVYREQVQHAHLLAHRIAQELFVSIFNLSADSIQLRLRDVMDVFTAFYSSMVSTRKHHSGLVKGSLAAPSNRTKLEEIMKAEAYRQEKAAAELRRFWGVAQREVQSEAERIGQRCANTLVTFFTMMKSLVTPEHLVPGEEVLVGKHRGLKRLMRQRQREGLAQKLEGTAAEAAASKKGAKGGKGDSKKADVKETKPSASKKGKGKEEVKEEDDVPPLPPLERQTQEFIGITLNGVRVFDYFQRDLPDVKLRNHYIPPTQWDSLDKKPEPEQVDTKAKPGAKPAKPPTGRAGDKKGAEVEKDPNAPIEIDETPVLSTTLTGTKDRLHQQAVLMRQQAMDNFTNFSKALAQSIESKMKAQLDVETAWVKSWEGTITSLRTENAKPVKPAPKAAPPAEQQPAGQRSVSPGKAAGAKK